MSYVVNGEELETGEEDFLLEANFSDDVPPVIAAAEKITLTDEHWTVINFMREKFKEDGSTPNFRNMLAEMDELHPGTDWKKKLYELFPNQPARQSARIAGRQGRLLIPVRSNIKAGSVFRAARFSPGPSRSPNHVFQYPRYY